MKQSISYFVIFFALQTMLFASHAPEVFQPEVVQEETGRLEPIRRAPSPSQEAFESLNQGDIYFYGLFDVAKDLDKAHHYYTKAAAPEVRPDIRNIAKQRLAEMKKEQQFEQANRKISLQS